MIAHPFSRRSVMKGVAAMIAGTASPHLSAAAEESGLRFDYESLIAIAQERAQEPFEDRRTPVEEPWLSMTFDQYRKIRFNPDSAAWRGERLFSLQFFHVGSFYDRETPIYSVREGMATPFAFDPAMYTYGDLAVADAPIPEGHAGFRIHYPLHSDRTHDEFAVFLGASYFRLIGRNQRYGVSARGLAVDTAAAEGEEFPAFVAFWIEEPPEDGTEIVLYALMDSPRITGAYRFVLRPRTESQMDIKATLFARQEIGKVGIAPLTSMYLFGENDRAGFDDFRPEVHDSDGLMMQTAVGEWLWRPLINPTQLQVSSLLDSGPRGFGLAQRDRDFANYQDLEAMYERRPGLWIQPLEDWGPGRVELVEIPSNSEIHDNIVAYWVSDQPFVPGEPREFTYLATAFGDHAGWPPGARVEATRIGSAARPGSTEEAPEEARLFVIDFGGGDLPHLREDQPIEAVVTTSDGNVANVITQKIPETGGWRAFFDYVPGEPDASTLRCYLRHRGNTLSETWTYLWTRT
ncbi:MAG: glucan biosynthesis protein [Alphaproteobacteria bacterium]